MTKRAHNFCAGPCTLPLEVLEEIQSEFVNYGGAGASLMEMSHRSKEYDAVHQEAIALALEISGAPDDFTVAFIQGGATMQFSMLAMNLLTDGQKGAYANSGAWAKKAIADAKHYGEVYTAWDGADNNYGTMPGANDFQIQDNTRYLHITANETIGGIRYHEWPDVDVPLIGDMSSEYLSRALPWDKFDLIYGGVQKNLAPAGMALVFVRKSILEKTNRALGAYLRYDIHCSKESLYNTPAVFVIYAMGKVLKWMKANGGLAGMEAAAEKRSSILYDAIDGSGGYFNCPVDVASRSQMNVVWRLPSEELEAKFIAEAKDADLLNLKGHRSVGGCRASIYNAMPEEGVRALTAFMAEFQKNNG